MGLLSRFFKQQGRSALSDRIYKKTSKYIHGEDPKGRSRAEIDAENRLADPTRLAWLAMLNKQRELTMRKQRYGDRATSTASAGGAGANFIYQAPQAKASPGVRPGTRPGPRGGPVSAVGAAATRIMNR